MKRLVKAFIIVEREEDIEINLEAIVTRERGRIYFNSITQDKQIQLTEKEYRAAEDEIFDSATHYWENFAEV